MRRSYRRALALGTLGIGLWTASWLAHAPAMASDGSPAAPRLDRVDPASEALSFRAGGIDPDSPRELVLWRSSGDGRFTRVSATRSEASGRFDFGQVPLLGGSSFFKVCAAGDAPKTGPSLRIERPMAAPLIYAASSDRDQIAVVPARREGELRFHDANTGRLLFRHRITARQEEAGIIDFGEALPAPRPEALSVYQVFDDGRRSARETWLLQENRD